MHGKRKTVGVIGGLGPMATVYFLELLTSRKKAQCDQDHLQVYTASIPQTPDRTAFILGESNQNPLPYMLEAGEKLISIGADFLAIPCVTAQHFQKELQENLQVPVLSMCHEVALELERRKVKTVAILATNGTLKSRLLQQEIESRDIVVLYPGEADQEQVMYIIYEQIKKGIRPDIESIQKIGERLYSQGADLIILGCTELSLLKKEGLTGEEYLDVLDVLADRVIHLAQGS